LRLLAARATLLAVGLALPESSMTLLAILALGFFLGMRHATDADHVVAVTTIVSRARSARAALGVGALWGLGHSATILVVGGAIVLFGWVVPPRVGLSMELSVALMLIVLGGANLSGALKHIGRIAHGHTHEGARKRPRTIEDEVEPPLSLRKPGFWRPLLIGVVHGLAGSAAIALLVLATIKSAKLALVYLGVFGFGTLSGMMLLTTAMSWPLAAVTSRFEGAERLLARATGLMSLAFGLFLAYRIGFVDGLLLDTPHWSPH
jgi:high-affinity nickel-transport protein